MPAETPVLIIDPDHLSRHGLKTILENRGFQVLSAVATVYDAPEQSVLDVESGVALVDRSIVENSVEDTLAKLKKWTPSVQVIFLGNSLDFKFVIACYLAGASGFVLKSVESEVVTSAIRMVLHGERVYPSELISEFLEGRISQPGHLDAKCCEELRLSEREQQILQGLVQGESNKMIANTLAITEATVKAHLQGLMRKINVGNRTQLAVWAVDKMQV